jgi:hypothetical protein
MNWKASVQYVAERLSEPSTYATLTALLGITGFNIAPGYMQDVMFFGMSVSAVAGVMFKEGVKQALSSGDALTALQARITALENNTPKT